MSRFAPFCAVLLLGSAACLFEPPTAPPPSLLDPKDAGAIDRDPIDAGERDAEPTDTSSTSMDAGTDGGAENLAPIAVTDSATTSRNTPIAIAVLGNDSDPDGDPISIASFTPPANGTAQMIAGGIEYSPGAGYVGSDQFTYRITDGRGGTADAEVRLVITGGPPLVLQPMSAEINLNSRGSFMVSGGTPPYVFSIATGTGEIGASSGEFFSPGIPGSARVLVSDSGGQSRTASVTFGNGDLFYTGGFGIFGDEEEVFRSNDGVSWQNVGSLPVPIYLHSAVVFEDQIFVAGGRNQTFEASQLLLVSTDGINWTTRGMLPVLLRGTQLIVFEQRLFLIGGRDELDVNHDEVWSSSDGTTWIIEGRLPAARAYGTAFVHRGELWYAGGWSQGADEEVWSSPDGTNWTPRTALPSAKFFMGGAVHGGQMWFIGGTPNGDDGTAEVWRTTDTTSFTSATNLPEDTASAQAMHWRNDLWVVGGGTRFNSNSVPYDAVLTMNPNGDWVQVGNLPAPRFHGSMVIFAP